MRVAAPNIGRRSSICWLTRTKRGLRTQPFLSSSFHEGISIITTNRQSPIRMTAERHGRISRCKASTRVWLCMGCKDSITIGRAKSCGFRRNSKSKQWQPLAGQVRRNYFLKNCRLARVRMTDGRFRKASLRDRSELNSFGHSYAGHETDPRSGQFLPLPGTSPSRRSAHVALLQSKTAQ